MKVDENKVILIAEDDDDDFLLIQEAYKESALNYPLHRVVNGEELLSYLNRQGQYRDIQRYPWPFLVLLDINMPRKNGLEALEEIKATNKLKSLPVIIFTTSSSEDSVIKGYSLGANSYIVKPATFDGLLALCKKFNRYWFETVKVSRTKH